MNDTDDKRARPALAFDERLLAVLACPETQAPLVYDRNAGELVSVDAGVAYPVREGIAVLLVEEARIIDNARRSGRGGLSGR